MRFKTLFMVCMGLLLAGCGATAYVQKVEPVKSSLSSYQTVLVKVKSANPTMESQDGFTESKSQLENDFVTNLADTKKFQTVALQTDTAMTDKVLLINLTVEDFAYVSGAASVMWGVMSGNARFKVLAQLVDMQNGTVIGELRSGSQTRSSGGIFRGSTGTLITDISQKLAAEIASYQ